MVALPVNESVAGDRQQFSAVFVVKGTGAVGKLHASGQSAQTCREETRLTEDRHTIQPTGQTRRPHYAAQNKLNDKTSMDITFIQCIE